MKKLLSLLLIVLGMSANVAFAGGITQLAENMEGGEALIAQIRTVLAQDPVYHAQLTGYASSTGGGVVYVTKDLTSDPRETETYEEGDSNVKVNGTNLAMRGVTDFPVYIAAWAKPNPGYYFVGWSYSDGGTDLASIQVPNPSYDSEDPESEEYLTFPEEEYVNAYDVATAENETIDYVVYATFEPYRLTSYTVEGNTTTTSRVSNLTVKCTIDRAGATLADFESFTIKDKSAGTWTIGDATINGQELSVPVTFTADNTNAGDFSAVLEVKTYAGIAMNVPLRTRTVVLSDVQAIRYSKNKDFEDEGDLADMIEGADPTDVIKLNKDYTGQVVATKSFTLDLNGYNLTHNFNGVVADYSTPQGQVHADRIAKAAIWVNNADAVVTLAYSPYGGKVIAGPYNDAVDVTAGKLVLNGGTLTGFFGIGSMGGDVVQNGATIIASATTQTAVACMGGDYTMTDGKIYGLFGSMGGVSAATVTINGGTIDNTEQTIEGVSLSGGVGVQIGTNSTAWIRKGTILAKTFGVQSTTTPAGGDITIEKLAVIKGGSYALDCGGGTTTVNCGKFEDPAKLWNSNSGNAVFVSGYFQTNTSNVTEVLGKQVWRNTSGAEYREDYNFFAGSAEDAQAAGVSVCHIGGTSYSSLEDALAYANNTSEKVTIIIDNDYTLPAGYYTLPANAAILIPYYDEQGSMTPIVDRINKVDAPKLLKPFKWRCLTLADGVNLDVFGTIEVSGRQYSNGNLNSGDIYGAYGQLHLNKGSKIVLQNGSILRAWGYVTSGAGLEESGEIDVRRGATVYELFQMGDWTDPLAAAQGLLSGDEVFPLNTYFIQNIEAPAKYHPGSHLISATTVCEAAMGMTVMMSADDIQIIGESRMENPDVAMFLMDAMADAENTWVRKWYDPRTDQQVYDINSGAHIGQLVIPLVSSPLFPQMGKLIPEGADGIMGAIGGMLSSVDIPESIIMNSGQYNLPITNNFKLHLLSGRLDFTQNTELLPGSELEVDKEAKVTILKSAGQNSRSLYVFDWEDWETWAEGAYARRVQYSPSFDGQPDVRPVDDREAIGSAKVNVHGTFDTEDGFVFTSEHGGNIFSTVEDAGTFIITMPLTGEDGYDPDYAGDPKDYTVSVSQKSGSATFIPVWLKNEGEDDYTYAGALGELDDVFCYMNFDGTGGKWKKLVFEDCFVKDESDVYYAKPQEYVALTSGTEDPVTHTYSDAAGAGRLFILIAGEGTDCQWWEVEAKDNYFHCIHPENDTYYEWDNVNNKWKEKKFTITWKDWDGSIITTYSVPYGTQAEWLTTKPTRSASVDYTYDFTGWSPALGKVTSDVTYTATYEEKQIKYTITFVQDGGVEIERHLLARDEMPVCENVPTRTGYILQWEPAIEPVVGNQTYTATWLPEPPETYTITFKNYDGEVLLEYKDETAVEAGITPEYTGDTPTKTTATNEYNYTFAGWKPALTPATENATYVAQFLEEPVAYAINFFEEDGETQIGETQYIPYGGYPIIPSYSKENTAQFTYSIHWADKVNGQSIQTVTKDVDYVAVVDAVTNQYSVKLVSNPSGACILTGNGIYEYNEAEDAVTISVTNIAANHTFIGWSDGNKDLERTMPITGNINLVANFTVEDPDYTIHWWNEAGTIELVEPVGQKANTSTIYPGATPTKKATAQYSYTFDGWATVANGERAYKKGMTPKATQNANYYAHFDATVNNYEVTVTASPASAATFSGLGTYPYNEEADAVTLTVIPNTGYNFTGWSDGQGGTNLVRQMPITGNINLVANFELVEPDYTITWKSEDGTQTLAEVGHKYKTQSTYQGDTPTKEATAQYTYTFDGWTSQANGAGTYFADGSTPKVMADATYYAHFIESLIVIPDMEIGITDSEDLNNEVVERKNLVITSNGIDASGELLGAESLTITGEAIFRMEKNFAAQTWYAVAVPWTVALDGIRDKNGDAFADGTVYVLEFDANAYATADRDGGRTDYWHFLDQYGHDMQPGKLYMIWFRNAQTAVEFHKTSGSLWNTATEVVVTGGDGSQANWNGIANPALYYANLATGATDVLKYNGNDAYVIGTTTNMIVGEPVFVQVGTPQPVVAVPVGGASPAPAYRHAPQTATETDNRFVLELAQFGKLNDRMIVQTAKEKADTYVIGKDLAKMGLSALSAQMWINRYDAKLCKNTVALQGESVEYPLNISAPAAGEYVLSATQERGEATLYLTYNGEAIWNLSEGDYLLALENGTATNYGLRVRKAPQVTTGMDEALVDAQGDIRKVIINDKVFIIRGNQVYSIDGQLVK